jgi:hypothetical protein
MKLQILIKNSNLYITLQGSGILILLDKILNSSINNGTQSPPNLSLRNAWKIFAQYDENAKLQQKDFNRLQKWVMALGVIATVLVLSQSQFRSFF